MLPGDFLVTPSWTFHDHGNPGAKPAIWLDGLDVPMVNLFDTSFLERGAGEQHSSAPVFRYPYVTSRGELERFRQSSAPHEAHGYKISYVNPETGGPPMPTIAAFLQLLPQGFAGRAYRSTDSTVFCCVEGNGKSRVGENVFEWTEHDVFVVPSWRPVAHEATADAVLFSFSDRPAQQALGFWREENL
jgi:gentisate 1,2-dioxygenase